MNKICSSLRVYAGILLTLQITVALSMALTGCASPVPTTPSASLPTVPSSQSARLAVQRFHEDFGDAVLTITWVDPLRYGNEGYYYYSMFVFDDGYFSTQWTEGLGLRAIVDGNFTAEEMGELHQTLEQLADEPTPADLYGTMVITVGFHLDSQPHVRTYGDLNAPDELLRLFDLADEAVLRREREEGITYGHVHSPFREE